MPGGDNRRVSPMKLSIKMARKAKSSREMTLQDIKKTLGKNNACYVLITCTEPSEDGKMQVEMAYEGDECLAAYLIESAQNQIERALDDTSASIS